jgi:hypothetical protein
MKRIYMALALVAGLAVGAQAQKSVDLGIRILNPLSNTTRANFNIGDTLKLSIELSNNGTAAVAMTDSIKSYLHLQLVGDNTHYYKVGYPQMTLAAGAKDTFTLPLIKTTTTALPNDTKFCTWMTVFGFEQNGTVFSDVGFDLAAHNAATTLDQLKAAFTGNNIAKIDNYQTGTGANNLCGITGIIEFNGGDKTGLNIYPNPASSEVKIKHTLASNDHATVRVMDITGRQLITKDFGKQTAGDKEFTLDVNALQNGIYYIELITDNGRAISKLTIKK